MELHILAIFIVAVLALYCGIKILNWYETKKILERGDHATARAIRIRQFIEEEAEATRLSKAIEVTPHKTPAELELQRKWGRDDWRNSN